MSKKQVDWEAIEPQWRAGIKSKLQLSEEFGVSRAALDKHFAKEGIERDLSAKIKAKAQALVTQGQVTPKVTPESKVTEREIVEANATMQADIIRAHRTDIQRSRRLVIALLAELEELTGNPEEITSIMESVASGDEAKTNDAIRKVMSLPSRTDTIKKLADALKVLVAMERQAFSLDDSDGGDENQYHITVTRRGKD